ACSARACAGGCVGPAREKNPKKRGAPPPPHPPPGGGGGGGGGAPAPIIRPSASHPSRNRVVEGCRWVIIGGSRVVVGRARVVVARTVVVRPCCVRHGGDVGRNRRRVDAGVRGADVGAVIATGVGERVVARIIG